MNQTQAVLRWASQQINRMLRVRHEANNTTVLTRHTRNGVHGAVEVIRVAEHHTPLSLQRINDGLVRLEATLPMLRRDKDLLAGLKLVRPRSLRISHFQIRVRAMEV